MHSGRWGPCCSIAPQGMSTVSKPSLNAFDTSSNVMCSSFKAPVGVLSTILLSFPDEEPCAGICGPVIVEILAEVVDRHLFKLGVAQLSGHIQRSFDGRKEPSVLAAEVAADFDGAIKHGAGVHDLVEGADLHSMLRIDERSRVEQRLCRPFSQS